MVSRSNRSGRNRERHQERSNHRANMTTQPAIHDLINQMATASGSDATHAAPDRTHNFSQYSLADLFAPPAGQEHRDENFQGRTSGHSDQKSRPIRAAACDDRFLLLHKLQRPPSPAQPPPPRSGPAVRLVLVKERVPQAFHLLNLNRSENYNSQGVSTGGIGN